MNEIVSRSDMTVQPVRSAAQDGDVIFAARVSTQGERTLAKAGAEADDRDQGLIGTQEQHQLVDESLRNQSLASYDAYRRMLDAGVAREVARTVLPLNLYTTMNARALMNFLGLRTKKDNAAFPSFAQREIEMVAEQMEDAFRETMPLTHAAFGDGGRIAP